MTQIVEPDHALVRIDAARRALSSARTVPELKTLVDQAGTLRYWLKRRGASFDTLHVAAELKLRAERRLGEVLSSAGERRGRVKSVDGTLTKGTPTSLPKDVTKQRAHDWRQLFILSDAAFEQYLAATKTEQLEPTLVGAMRLLRDAARSKRKAAHRRRFLEQELPNGKYYVIYADPPWPYDDSGVVTTNDAYGRAERHFPTMTLDDIKALKVPAACNCVTFLWVPTPLLPDGFAVLDAWGFEYKTDFVWDKVLPNFGHYCNLRHENLLLGTRGDGMVPDVKVANNIKSIVQIKRSRTHSEKPDAFRDIIDTLYPPLADNDRLELFARKDVKGWARWGNEVPTS